MAFPLSAPTLPPAGWTCLLLAHNRGTKTKNSQETYGFQGSTLLHSCRTLLIRGSTSLQPMAGRGGGVNPDGLHPSLCGRVLNELGGMYPQWLCWKPWRQAAAACRGALWGGVR